MNLILLVLVLLGSPRPRDEMTATLRTPETGGTVYLNLTSLKPEDSFRITWSGKTPVLPGKEPGTYHINNVLPGKGRNEIVIVHRELRLRITIEIVSTSKRHCDARWVTLFGKRFAAISLFDPGKGIWKTDFPKDLPIGTADKITVNTVQINRLAPLAECETGGLYLLSNEQLQPWFGLAEKYYRSIVNGDWKGFVSCYNALNRRNADRYATCRLHWRAGRAWVKRDGVRKYVFSHVDQRWTTEKKKKLFFRRLNDKGRQIGLPLPITMELENGLWVVTKPSQ